MKRINTLRAMLWHPDAMVACIGIWILPKSLAARLYLWYMKRQKIWPAVARKLQDDGP